MTNMPKTIAHIETFIIEISDKASQQRRKAVRFRVHHRSAWLMEMLRNRKFKETEPPPFLTHYPVMLVIQNIIFTIKSVV